MATSLGEIDRFLDRGNFKKAANWCSKNETKLKSYSIFNYKCGFAYLKLAKYKKAISAFDLALKNGLDGSVDLRRAQFNAYYLSKSYKKAVEKIQLDFC